MRITTKKQIRKLLSMFSYCPETGVFMWEVKASNSKRRPGDIAGVKDGRGYLTVTVESVHYPLHRLAFLFMTGRFPKVATDHKNGIRDDNRWANLREATIQENTCNMALTSRNSSGEKGVSAVLVKSTNQIKWRATIAHHGKTYHLGRFNSVPMAALAVKLKRKELHGEFARNE